MVNQQSYSDNENRTGASGVILESAFVDPAYSYQAAEGQGKHAIELQATPFLLQKVETSDELSNVCDTTTDSSSTRQTTFSDIEKQAERELKRHQRTKMTSTKEMVETYRGYGWFKCCKSTDILTERHNHEDPVWIKREAELKAKLDEASRMNVERQQKENQEEEEHGQNHDEGDEEEFSQSKYGKVNEGLLVYRLNTGDNTMKLVSRPSSNTNKDTLMREMVITGARPSGDKTRRGIYVTGQNGNEILLTACEQRTAISWLEAMDIMLCNNEDAPARRSIWSSERLDQSQKATLEEDYLNLTSYSNNLLTAANMPTGSKDKVGGIYYSVSLQREEGDGIPEESLESIAKRRAVIKDSWDFYRMLCSLLRDKRKYDEVFRKLQLDPVYPYLNSMTGLNDPGHNSFENLEKPVTQRRLTEHGNLSQTQVCEHLVSQANDALSSLVEICKALAGCLGMEEVGVGPIKEIPAAMRKAEKKYGGDLYKVTDYCRALLVVKDMPTLLALLELARDSFGPLIRRVKLSSLKSGHKSLSGGYRDCKINVELQDHICEIQIHILPLWNICGVEGFRHYRHALEYSTDTFDDSYQALEGLDSKAMAEMIVMAEEAVAEMPLDSLEWQNERFILDYFAEVGLFMRHNHFVWAEVTLRQLIKLRCESPDIGPEHHETLMLLKYLRDALRMQKNMKEADEINDKLQSNEMRLRKEGDDAKKSLWGCFATESLETLDMIMDPNKKDREEDEERRKAVKASKRAWRKIREQKFRFLDEETTSGR